MTGTPLALVFREQKETKGTFKFEEVVDGDLAEPKIGVLYVRKATLGELGWRRGDGLRVAVERVE